MNSRDWRTWSTRKYALWSYADLALTMGLLFLFLSSVAPLIVRVLAGLLFFPLAFRGLYRANQWGKLNAERKRLEDE